MLSIVIPVFNEQDNIFPLQQRIIAALEHIGDTYEVILVNDGSTDSTEAHLHIIATEDKRFKVVNFRRNFGQTAAIMAGIEFSSGEIIVGLDGDLQNDPKDIPKLLEKLAEGYDVVSGWRSNRSDSALKRNLPSRIANWLVSAISGIHLHDYGCSLKVYKRHVIKDVKLYGEMHRFIPIYASWQGGKVAEIQVDHHPRVHGKSSYGLERVGKVLLDLIVVKFLAKYANKPIYVFGGFGGVCILAGIAAGFWALYLKLFSATSFISTPLPLLVAISFITGFMSILMGLIAEIIMRTYYESQDKRVYLVKDTANLPSSL